MNMLSNRLLVLIILVVVALVTVVRTLPPAPLPADVSPAVFSAKRALKHIQVIAQEPHPTGSAANARVRNYILQELKSLGFETETRRAGVLENVMGRLPGTHSTEAILLTAHLDSVAESPGATDDGSGVAVLLETARALQTDAPFRNSLIFLFTDFEEGGLVGAEAFIADHPWARDVGVVIGFDAGGLSGPGVLTMTSAENGWLLRQLVRADPSITGSSAINALGQSGTDFGYAFRTSGFSGYAFDLYWDRRIHTPADNIANVSLASLQHQGDHALSLARHFGRLERLSDPREPDAVYFNIWRSFTVTYPSTWAIPLALLVTAIFGGVLVSGLRRNILAWRALGEGIFTALQGIILAPVPGLLLGNWGTDMSFRFLGRLLDRPPQVAAAVLLAIGLIVSWYAVSQRSRTSNLPNLTMGALLIMWPAMVGTSIVFPALSFLFTWPLLFSLLACANWFYWRKREKNSKTILWGPLVSGAANIIILGPTLMLGLFDQMTVTLLLLGILCGFLLPLIYFILGYALDNQEAGRS